MNVGRNRRSTVVRNVLRTLNVLQWVLSAELDRVLGVSCLGITMESEGSGPIIDLLTTWFLTDTGPSL